MSGAVPIHPYENLPPHAFWRTGAVQRMAEAITEVYRPKFPIDQTTRIAAAGSCFAQRMGRHLRSRGYDVIDLEPPPPGLTPEEEAQYGFGLYSARYGNIYTARQLRLLAEEAFGLFKPAAAIWRKDGRFYDALRPTIEPEGLGSERAVRDQRRYHLRRVQELFRTADVLLFTLGLTEAWAHPASGTVYPLAPGVACGAYDPAAHQLRNFTAEEVHADLCAFLALARSHNPNLKLVLTVSPQRPVATASGKHVVVAAGYSKAVLRAAAGRLESESPCVDYFPAYDIVNSPFEGTRFFNPNLRTISDAGAAAVLDMFLAVHEGVTPATAPASAPEPAADSPDDDVCDEILLESSVP